MCHTISPLDLPKGPPLYEAGSRYKRDELIESILKPSAKIAQGFETKFFLLNDGAHEFVGMEAALHQHLDLVVAREFNCLGGCSVTMLRRY